jgi:hypothetical protein
MRKLLLLLLLVPSLVLAQDIDYVQGASGTACSGVATNTSNTAIKAAVTGARIYVRNITCSNTSSVPSEVKFKDGTTVVWQGAVGNIEIGGLYTSGPLIPALRGTSATAFNFSMTTTATATTCCINYFISAQ